MSPERYPYNRDAHIEDLWPPHYVKCDFCGARMDKYDDCAPKDSNEYCCYECLGKAEVRAELRNEDH